MPPTGSPALKDRATVRLPLRGQGGESLTCLMPECANPLGLRCRSPSKCPKLSLPVLTRKILQADEIEAYSEPVSGVYRNCRRAKRGEDL